MLNERARLPELGPDAVVAPMNWEKTAELAWTCANGISKARQRRAVEWKGIVARKSGKLGDEDTMLVVVVRRQ
jgi:hypothetical protein